MRTGIIVLALCLLAATVSAESFGHDTTGNDETMSLLDKRRFTEATAPANGDADSIVFYVEHTGDSTDCECALYLDGDSSLVDSTDMIRIGHDGRALVGFSFTSSPTVTASTVYRIGMTCDNEGTSCNIVAKGNVGYEYWWVNGGGAEFWTWDNPIVPNGGVDHEPMGGWVHYTPSGGAATGAQVIIIGN